MARDGSSEFLDAGGDVFTLTEAPPQANQLTLGLFQAWVNLMTSARKLELDAEPTSSHLFFVALNTPWKSGTSTTLLQKMYDLWPESAGKKTLQALPGDLLVHLFSNITFHQGMEKTSGKIALSEDFYTCHVASEKDDLAQGAAKALVSRAIQNALKTVMRNPEPIAPEESPASLAARQLNRLYIEPNAEQSQVRTRIYRHYLEILSSEFQQEFTKVKSTATDLYILINVYEHLVKLIFNVTQHLSKIIPENKNPSLYREMVKAIALKLRQQLIVIKKLSLHTENKGLQTLLTDTIAFIHTDIKMLQTLAPSSYNIPLHLSPKAYPDRDAAITYRRLSSHSPLDAEQSDNSSEDGCHLSPKSHSPDTKDKYFSRLFIPQPLPQPSLPRRRCYSADEGCSKTPSASAAFFQFLKTKLRALQTTPHDQKTYK